MEYPQSASAITQCIFFRYTKNKSTTSSGSTVYAFVFDWPDSGLLKLHAPTSSATTKVTLLGYGGNTPLQFAPGNPQGIMITVPKISINQMPCKWLWTFKITDVVN